MDPITLWLFFVLDRIIVSFQVLLTISASWLVGCLLVWLIGMGIKSSEIAGCSDKLLLNKENQKQWSIYFGRITKPFNILATVILSVSFLVTVFLPNTKEAVAIVVIPKVIKYAATNPEMVKIPNNILKMANSFMEKKIEDWTKDAGLETPAVKDTTKTPPVDSVIADLTRRLETAKKIKEDVGKILK